MSGMCGMCGMGRMLGDVIVQQRVRAIAKLLRFKAFSCGEPAPGAAACVVPLPAGASFDVLRGLSERTFPFLSGARLFVHVKYGAGEETVEVSNDETLAGAFLLEQALAPESQARSHLVWSYAEPGTADSGGPREGGRNTASQQGRRSRRCCCSCEEAEAGARQPARRGRGGRRRGGRRTSERWNHSAPIWRPRQPCQHRASQGDRSGRARQHLQGVPSQALLQQAAEECKALKKSDCTAEEIMDTNPRTYRWLAKQRALMVRDSPLGCNRIREDLIAPSYYATSTYRGC